MMRRLVMVALAVVAVTTPAVVGLFGSSSFVQVLSLPLRTSATPTSEGHPPAATPGPAATAPSDDNGGERPRDTSDDTSGTDHRAGSDGDSATSGRHSGNSGSDGADSGSGSGAGSSRHSGRDGSGSGKDHDGNG